MKRLEIANSECLAEGKKDNRDKEEFSRFKKFMDAGRELLKKTTTWTLVGATVAFMSCGGPAKNGPDEDGDADTVEMVEDEVDAPDVPDVTEDEIEVDVPTDEIEDGDVAEEDGELPPLECPAPVESLPPDINDMFEANVTDNLTTDDGRIGADYNMHLSMNPDVSITASDCSTGSGGFEFVCVDDGDVVNLEGQQYLVAGGTSFDATLEPASSETDICSTLSTEYPILAGAPETVMNVTYETIGIDSIAVLSIDALTGFYFDVEGTSYTVMDLSYTPTSAGIYHVYFKRNSASITFNSTSIDGRGSELENTHTATVLEGSSKGMDIVAVGAGQTINYDVEVQDQYGETTEEAIYVCTRCSGGPTHVDLSIPLDGVICASEDSECGCMGEPSNVSLENIEVSTFGPWGSHLTVGALTLSISVINGPSDNPSVQVPFDYSGPTDIDGIGVRIVLDVVVRGTGHVCSTGTVFDSRHHTIIYVTEPDADYYHPTDPSAICSCTFGG